jgi:hypothetical protein
MKQKRSRLNHPQIHREKRRQRMNPTGAERILLTVLAVVSAIEKERQRYRNDKPEAEDVSTMSILEYVGMSSCRESGARTRPELVAGILLGRGTSDPRVVYGLAAGSSTKCHRRRRRGSIHPYVS